MSRWPPEIAGTISHPAGRSAVTAERVPIFYSARSSSPSSSSSTRRRILPFSLSLTLSLLLSTPPPPPMHRGLSVLGRYNVSTRMDRSRFPPQKEGRKGWQKMAGSTKESRCPDNPDLSTPYPVLLFLLSPPASSHPLATFLSPVRIFPYRIGVGGMCVGCCYTARRKARRTL